MELPTAKAHRQHHERPTRLGLILLGPVEALALLCLAVPAAVAAGGGLAALLPGPLPPGPLVTGLLTGYVLVAGVRVDALPHPHGVPPALARVSRDLAQPPLHPSRTSASGTASPTRWRTTCSARHPTPRRRTLADRAHARMTIAVTEATREAQRLVRDPALFKWYAVALLALVLYAYANEVERGRLDVAAAAWRSGSPMVQRDPQLGRARGHRPRPAVGHDRPHRVSVPRRPERRDHVHVRAGRARLRQAPAPDRAVRVLGMPNGSRSPSACRSSASRGAVPCTRRARSTGTTGGGTPPFVPLIVVFGYLWFFLYAAWVFDAPCRGRACAASAAWPRSTSRWRSCSASASAGCSAQRRASAGPRPRPARRPGHVALARSSASDWRRSARRPAAVSFTFTARACPAASSRAAGAVGSRHARRTRPWPARSGAAARSRRRRRRAGSRAARRRRRPGRAASRRRSDRSTRFAGRRRWAWWAVGSAGTSALAACHSA